VLDDVVREIMEDPISKGNQKYSFELDLDAAGKRLYGGEANAGVAFQIGQIRYIIQYLWYCYKMQECIQDAFTVNSFFITGLVRGQFRNFRLPLWCISMVAL
jgi:hypothetical protein